MRVKTRFSTTSARLYRNRNGNKSTARGGSGACARNNARPRSQHARGTGYRNSRALNPNKLHMRLARIQLTPKRGLTQICMNTSYHHDSPPQRQIYSSTGFGSWSLSYYYLSYRQGSKNETASDLFGARIERTAREGEHVQLLVARNKTNSEGPDSPKPKTRLNPRTGLHQALSDAASIDRQPWNPEETRSRQIPGHAFSDIEFPVTVNASFAWQAMRDKTREGERLGCWEG